MLLLYGLVMFLSSSILILQMLLKQANSFSVKLSCISKKMKGIEKGKLPKNVISGTQNVGCLQYTQGE